MKEPTPQQKGPFLTRKNGNLYLAYAKSRTPLSGINTNVTDSAGGDGRVINAPATGSGSGTVLEPYEMQWSSIADEPFEDTWDIKAQPEGKDGVIWRGPRIRQLDLGAGDLEVSIPGGGSVFLHLFTGRIFTRECTFNTAGRLVYISQELEGGDIQFTSFP